MKKVKETSFVSLEKNQAALTRKSRMAFAQGFYLLLLALLYFLFSAPAKAVSGAPALCSSYLTAHNLDSKAIAEQTLNTMVEMFKSATRKIEGAIGLSLWFGKHPIPKEVGISNQEIIEALGKGYNLSFHDAVYAEEAEKLAIKRLKIEENRVRIEVNLAEQKGEFIDVSMIFFKLPGHRFDFDDVSAELKQKFKLSAHYNRYQNTYIIVSETGAAHKALVEEIVKSSWTEAQILGGTRYVFEPGQSPARYNSVFLKKLNGPEAEDQSVRVVFR